MHISILPQTTFTVFFNGVLISRKVKKPGESSTVNFSSKIQIIKTSDPPDTAEHVKRRVCTDACGGPHAQLQNEATYKHPAMAVWALVMGVPHMCPISVCWMNDKQPQKQRQWVFARACDPRSRRTPCSIHPDSLTGSHRPNSAGPSVPILLSSGCPLAQQVLCLSGTGSLLTLSFCQELETF